MKLFSYLSLLSLFLFNTSCFPLYDDDNEYYTPYEPLSLSREAFENSTELMDVQPTENSGKIYVKDNYLIINEPYKGFHIYDNSNPESPKKIKFLKVLGSTDLSIKNDVIYVNNAIDLIAITFNNDFNSINVTKRVRDIFPEILSPYGDYGETGEVIYDWVLTTN